MKNEQPTIDEDINAAIWLYCYENYQESLDLVQLHATEGNERALCHLAKHYYEGLGITQDKTKALQIWEELALKNYPPSQYILGTKYFFGKSALDKEKGLKFLQDAAKNDHSMAQYILEKEGLGYEGQA
jgi:TPR repeat protein